MSEDRTSSGVLDQTGMDDYFAGRKLYGDDFNLPKIQQWYEDEREGYAGLRRERGSSPLYEYHALNSFHGFRFLKGREFREVLGLGSASGCEFEPILHQVKHITVLEPSERFVRTDIGGVPCQYIKPGIDGMMPFEEGRFDLAVCLGVLHHIPNVTTVVRELYRCLSQGGYLLLREPIVSMGDWSKPRRHATKRERGIPLHILDDIVTSAGFHVVHRSLCVCPIVSRTCLRFGLDAYNSPCATRIDALLCRLLRHNVRYHATHLLHKIRPASVYFVLSKEELTTRQAA
jgi:SAM-dependent methyltransferase